MCKIVLTPVKIVKQKKSQKNCTPWNRASSNTNDKRFDWTKIVIFDTRKVSHDLTTCVSGVLNDFHNWEQSFQADDQPQKVTL